MQIHQHGMKKFINGLLLLKLISLHIVCAHDVVWSMHVWCFVVWTCNLVYCNACVCICVCLCACQRTIFWIWFSPSILFRDRVSLHDHSPYAPCKMHTGFQNFFLPPPISPLEWWDNMCEVKSSFSHGSKGYKLKSPCSCKSQNKHFYTQSHQAALTPSSQAVYFIIRASNPK